MQRRSQYTSPIEDDNYILEIANHIPLIRPYRIYAADDRVSGKQYKFLWVSSLAAKRSLQIIAIHIMHIYN